MLADPIEKTVPPGCRDLVQALEVAASSATVDEITSEVQRVLSEYAHEGRVELPEELRATSEGSYARRLIYRSENPAYTVLAMVWGPGQGTPVHDHSGLWCVEGVVEGRIEVTQYDLRERDGDRCRFEVQEKMDAGIGSSGRLIPPFDHHTISNPSADRRAITIHVYGGEMVRCKIYEPLGAGPADDRRGTDGSRNDGWYQESVRELTYSA